MARITCRTPSTGKGLNIIEGNVPTSFTSIVDAPDFSVPDASDKFPERDPTDANRAIRPGEIFFLTPLAAKNKDTETRWIEARLVTEESVVIELAKVEIPAGDTAFIPVQGRSLFKRNANSSIGDSLEVRAESIDIIDVWVSAEEKLSAEHTGVV